jgi:outer membrane cobalamin receptor
MRPYAPGGRAYARRLSSRFFLLTLFAFGGAHPAFAADQTGVVVDQNGRPLSRAHVRATRPGADPRQRVDTPSLELQGDIYTDESGHFVLAVADGCRLEVSLAGFRPASVPCAAAGDLRIELAVAPIEETVVVTATRTELRSNLVGASATTFTAEDIERRQTPVVSELLRTSPGAMVLQTGGTGGVTGLFVRGGESSYNAVLLDGIPINEPGGTFNFNNLTTENFERIEVVRGANSALFGSDAMSSVVQLFTRRARSSSPSGTAQIDGGSYGTLHASASASGAAGKLDYSAGAARFSSDNREPNSAFDSANLSANLGIQLNDRTTLRGVVRGEISEVGTPGQTAYGRADLDASYEHNDVVGGVTLDMQTSAALRQRATYGLAASHQASTNLVEDPPYTPAYQGRRAPFEFYDFTFDNRTTLRRHYASYQIDWRPQTAGARSHLLTALADWNGERAVLDDRLNASQVRAPRDNIGASVQHQLAWRRVATTAGVRVEKNENFGSAVAPRGSMVVTLRESGDRFGDTRLRAAAGLGIKEPTILQTFSTSPYFKGNPDLEPERSRAFEAGIEQRLAADRIKLGLTWFDNRYRNIIGLRSTGGYNSEYFNIGLTSARGTELQAETAPTRQLQLRGGYTFLSSEILESTSEFSPVFAVGQWAFRRPRHAGYVQVSWTWQQFTADLSGVAIGRYVDSDFSSLEPSILENAGRTTWDAAFSYRVTSKLTGLVSIANLTGLDYQEPLGYPALQRSIRVGARVTF